MFRKKYRHPSNGTIHKVAMPRREQQHRYMVNYWPILLFVLLSALTQTVGTFF